MSTEAIDSSYIDDASVQCGCVDTQLSASQEIAPETGVIMADQILPIVTSSPSTFTVGGASPSSVTFNFDPEYHHRMGDTMPMAGKVLLEIPEAGIKIVKVGHGERHEPGPMNNDDEYCMYDEFGSCMTCGY